MNIRIAILLCVAMAAFFLNACGDSVDASEQAVVDDDESSLSKEMASLSSSKANSSSSSVKASSSSSVKSSSSVALYPESFKPNDAEYPYAGIPRIVIETEKRQSIKDRETEIPAKLQIWGDSTAESEIMDLTIRGRGNSSWLYPKKPYLIKFEKKQSILGMPKAKKWVMLANYRDRTLIRNAIAFDIARYTQQSWVPQGVFVDVFLNGKPIGNYYLVEKISNEKQRLNLGDDAYLLEIDRYYDELYKFKTDYRELPVNVKDPNELSSVQISYIKDYVDSIENLLYNDSTSNYQNLIDITSCADYWIVYELTQNDEPNRPKSVYMYKENEGPLKMGPVWDFDWNTFAENKKGLVNKNAIWNGALLKRLEYRDLVQKNWNLYKPSFEKKVVKTIDSLNKYLKKSNAQNYQLWPIQIETGLIGDEDMSFEDAFALMKDVYANRIRELDSLFSNL